MPGSNLSTSHKITHLYSSKFYEIQSIIISYEQLRHGNVKLFNQSKQVGQLLNWSSDPILLLLIHVSRVRLCATPETAAHQAPPSLGFSRQEHWSGLPFPSPPKHLRGTKVYSDDILRITALIGTISPFH